jgi:16S rRNA (guanine527-N7)-methyltransferase
MAPQEDGVFLTQLQTGIDDLGLNLPENTAHKLLDYMALLIKWNKAYNLTAIVEPHEIITHHFLDSLSLVPYIKGQSVLDVGSGAGFPGIPCALALPEKRFVLLDSNGKKTRFTTQAAGLLGLKNVESVHARVEDYQAQPCFDTITARAFAAIDKIIAVTSHLLCPTGELLLMKGTLPQAELQNVARHAKVSPLTVPGLNEQRHLVCIKGLSDG